MGRPVVHFEIVGADANRLRSFYGQLFDWTFDTNNPMDYGIVSREENLSADGVGIGGGVGGGPEGYPGHVTFYVEVPDVGASLAQAESLGGTRVMGPEEIGEGMQIGLFTDPEGHLIGLFRSD